MTFLCKTTGRRRDSQRSKVYAAEEAVDAYEWGPIARLETCQKRASQVVASGWVLDAYPHMKGVEVDVRPATGKYAWIVTTQVHMPPKHLSMGLLLHELAHCVHLTNPTWNMEAPHGPRFCDIYLKLIHRFIGRRQSHTLEASFKKNGVAYA